MSDRIRSFDEAYEALRESAAKIGDSVCLKVEAWAVPNEGPRLCWTVWSVKHKAHYSGATAEEALCRYYLGERPEDVAQDEIANVGVPSCG